MGCVPTRKLALSLGIPSFEGCEEWHLDRGRFASGYGRPSRSLAVEGAPAEPSLGLPGRRRLLPLALSLPRLVLENQDEEEVESKPKRHYRSYVIKHTKSIPLQADVHSGVTFPADTRL